MLLSIKSLIGLRRYDRKRHTDYDDILAYKIEAILNASGECLFITPTCATNITRVFLNMNDVRAAQVTLLLAL